MIRRWILLLWIALCWPLASVAAHPHVFIDAQTEFIVTKGKIRGAIVHWAFDEIFSSALIQDYDKNKNGRFEANEIVHLELSAFRNLVNFSYFTHFFVENSAFPIQKVTDFWAEIQKNGRVLYHFSAYLPDAIDASKESVRLAFYDETYYVDITLLNHLSAVAKNKACSRNLQDLTADFEYAGMFTPKSIVLVCPSS